MIYIGIDPGKNGGIAFLDSHGVVDDVVYMPETPRDLLDLLEPYSNEQHRGAFAMIEQVGVMPKQGIVSAFTFGQGYGGLIMALTAQRIPWDAVLPARWQMSMKCLTRGDKNVTKRRAQQLFPSLTITHAIADALLIAEYCRRVHGFTDGKEEGRGAQGSTEARGQGKRRPDGWTEGEAEDLRTLGLDPDKTVVRRAPPARPAVANAPRARAGSQRAAR